MGPSGLALDDLRCGDHVPSHADWLLSYSDSTSVTMAPQGCGNCHAKMAETLHPSAKIWAKTM